jgi:transcriptional regulator with PAS, ATPase and Fis domain
LKFLNPDASQSETAEQLDLGFLMTDTRWQLLADVLPDCIILIDGAGVVRYINPAAESANEVLRVEVVGRSLQDFVDKSPLSLGFTLQAFAGGSRVNRIVSAATNGEDYRIITRCVRDRQGNIACFVIVAHSLDALADATDGAAKGAVLREGFGDAAPLANAAPENVILGELTTALVARGLKTLVLGSRLLLLGESGVGKTEFARLLHRRSGSPSRPFIHVNCGSIPETLFESEMFGYERGSFTGALNKGKRGLVEAADGGVLFLDEVGEIPLPSQAKMLQFLEEGGVQRVGATHVRRLRVQIVAATNRDLRKMVADGSFRLDLFYRLNVVTLRLPPLRECRDILDELIDRFLTRVNQRRSTAMRMDRSCRQYLRSYEFPGNVRELENLIEHLAVVCDGPVREKDIGEAISNTQADSHRPATIAACHPVDGESLSQSVKRFEDRLIQDAIARTGSKRKAAELLGVNIATVVRKSRNPDRKT